VIVTLPESGGTYLGSTVPTYKQADLKLSVYLLNVAGIPVKVLESQQAGILAEGTATFQIDGLLAAASIVGPQVVVFFPNRCERPVVIRCCNRGGTANNV